VLSVATFNLDLEQQGEPMNFRCTIALILAAFSAGSILRLPIADVAKGQERSIGGDRQALISLENDWLTGEHNSATLDRILAADFVHPVTTGDFLDKSQHISYSTKHLPPANLRRRFDHLNVRLYGDVGIVNGIVITSNELGKDVDRSIFTDVFVYRDGRWQAVNAQENRVQRMQPRN
jgi:hypothetical protein